MSQAPRVAPAEMTDRTRYFANPKNQLDIAETFRRMNPSMCDSYGQNAWSAENENDNYNMLYWMRNESKQAHGYPYTFYMQAGIFYATAYYTARSQGLPAPHLFYKSHWFDWITCFKRFAIFGIAGGLVLGTVLFGDTSLSLKRVYNRYNRLCFSNPENMYSAYPIPFTNK